MKDIVALGKNKNNDAKKFLENKNPIVILYELQGCPHCTAIETPWADAIKILKAHKDVKDYIDCANAVYYYDKGIKAKGKKSRLDNLPEQLQGISGFPTIHIIKNGITVDEFNGDRNENSIVEFVLNFVSQHPELKKIKATPSTPTPTKVRKVNEKAKPRKVQTKT